TLMAVPGPVTSALSAGCHRLLRDYQAVCVTSARDVIEQLSPVGTEPPAEDGVRVGTELLDDTARRLLDALPERGSAGVAVVAAAGGLSPDAALRHLGLLAAAGHVERTATGWRRRTSDERRSRGRKDRVPT